MQGYLAAHPELSYCDVSGEWPVPPWVRRLEYWIADVRRQVAAVTAKKQMKP